MKILLTNDDGIHAQGLWMLYKQFHQEHDTLVVAPDRERSAVGHGITLHEPLRTCRIEVNGGYKGFAVNGTPADCIKMGVTELCDAKPDLVISGINPGANLGININYSGTVAAAREAALYGIAAMAVSIHAKKPSHYDESAEFVAGLARMIFESPLPFGSFLNINLPDLPLQRIKGVRISRQGIKQLTENFEKRLDPRNRPYFWYGSESPADFDQTDSDEAALAEDCIAITPIKCDVTDYQMVEALKRHPLSNLLTPKAPEEPAHLP